MRINICAFIINHLAMNEEVAMRVQTCLTNCEHNHINILINEAII